MEVAMYTSVAQSLTCYIHLKSIRVEPVFLIKVIICPKYFTQVSIVRRKMISLGDRKLNNDIRSVVSPQYIATHTGLDVVLKRRFVL
jgi:hypothetical protein